MFCWFSQFNGIGRGRGGLLCVVRLTGENENTNIHRTPLIPLAVPLPSFRRRLVIWAVLKAPSTPTLRETWCYWLPDATDCMLARWTPLIPDFSQTSFGPSGKKGLCFTPSTGSVQPALCFHEFYCTAVLPNVTSRCHVACRCTQLHLCCCCANAA